MWNKIFGGAEGIREAMRESYENHVRAAREGTIPTGGDSPHTFGLYGALASRYLVRRIPSSEIAVLSELAPFHVMKETEAVEALAEYVVFCERPQDAQVTWLKAAINRALNSSSDSSWLLMAGNGLANGAAWGALLEPSTMEAIEKAIEDAELSGE